MTLPQEYIDEVFREDIWDSYILVRVELSEKEAKTSHMSYLFMVPRQGYLINIFGAVGQAFEKEEEEMQNMWFEYLNYPIKWNLPFGVIADALNMNVEKPVKISVRFKDRPDNVLPYTSLDDIRFYFMNSSKEANQIKFPKKKIIMDLNGKDTKTLKDGPYSLKGKEMLTSLRYITNVINKVDKDEEKKIEKFPVKLVLDKTNVVLIKSVDLKGNKNYTMKEFMIDIFGEETYKKIKEKCYIKIHGIEIEDLAYFLFYYNNFYYLDHFLYIVFVDKNMNIK